VLSRGSKLFPGLLRAPRAPKGTQEFSSHKIVLFKQMHYQSVKCSGGKLDCSPAPKESSWRRSLLDNVISKEGTGT
jgi:hypothetical protein